jgi:hypothetical protein
MAEFTVVKEADAPKAPASRTKLTARMEAYDVHVLSIRKGQVGKVVPGEGETLRGESLRVSRAAKRVGKTANTWAVDGALYFTIS